MNENREISAKSQHDFHFLPHFNSKASVNFSKTSQKLLFTIFSHDVVCMLGLATTNLCTNFEIYMLTHYKDFRLFGILAF